MSHLTLKKGGNIFTLLNEQIAWIQTAIYIQAVHVGSSPADPEVLENALDKGFTCDPVLFKSYYKKK